MTRIMTRIEKRIAQVEERRRVEQGLFASDWFDRLTPEQQNEHLVSRADILREAIINLNYPNDDPFVNEAEAVLQAIENLSNRKEAKNE